MERENPRVHQKKHRGGKEYIKPEMTVDLKEAKTQIDKKKGKKKAKDKRDVEEQKKAARR